MEKFSELLPVFGFVLSLGLFGYGLKKILIKVENDTSGDQKIKINGLKIIFILFEQSLEKNFTNYFLKIYNIKKEKKLINNQVIINVISKIIMAKFFNLYILLIFFNLHFII